MYLEMSLVAFRAHVLALALPRAQARALPHRRQHPPLGVASSARDPTEVRRRVGVLLENDGLYDRLSARRNLLFHARIRQLSREESDRRIEELLIAFGIAVSTILGRFVIPIYYVLGERLVEYFARGRGESNSPHRPVVENHVPGHEPIPAAVH